MSTKVFDVHKRCYGTRRLRVELRRKGYRVGRQRLRKAMRWRGLPALQPQAFTPRTTDSTHELRCAPNRLLHQPKPTRDNQVWGSDIICLALAGSDWAYRCAYQDMVSKRVVGWQVGASTDYHRLAAGFLGAVAHTRPARARRPGRAVRRRGVPQAIARPRGPTLAKPARRLRR
jgi:hypothetical protein